MQTNIILGDEFKRQFKRLNKKYKSLTDDYLNFRKEQIANPMQGSDLGGGVRKIRMPISSKGKGNSGGARVITFNVLVRQEPDDELNITLLTIYDKNEISNLANDFIQSLIDVLDS